MLLVSLLAAAGLASTWPALPKWHISTNRLTIQAGSLAADFTIVNDDRVNERFEVVAYSWSQRGSVDTRLPDTNDVLIFPRLFELAPGESKRVRVGVLARDPLIESDYRIAVEQLFDPQKGKPGLHFLLAYDLPLFIEPTRAIVDTHIVGITARDASLRVTMRNDGDVHVFARAIVVRWLGVSVRHGQPFYVLPHSTMTFTLAMQGCGNGLATIAPDLDSHIQPLTAPLSIPCR